MNSQTPAIKFLESADSLGTMESEIRNAKTGEQIVIKMQTWRADEVGFEMARACICALENGAKITIFKDQIGVPFERGEGSGHGLFPSSGVASWKGKMMRALYEKPPPDNSVLPERDRIWQQLQSWTYSDRLQIFHAKRYDHSKLVLKIDQNSGKIKKAFSGGVFFGAEFQQQQNDFYADSHWADGMFEINDEEILTQIAHALAGKNSGMGENGVEILTSDLGKNKKTYSRAVLELVKNSTKKILAACPYFGDVQMVAALESKNSDFVIPEMSNWSKDRTRHFFWEISRRIQKGFAGGFRSALAKGDLGAYWSDFFTSRANDVPPNVQIRFARRMVHLKAFVVDQTKVVLGSGNFSETFGWGFYPWMEKGARIAEFGLLLDAEKNPKWQEVVDQVQNYIENLVTPESRVPPKNIHCRWFRREFDASQDKDRVFFSLFFSQVEHFSLSFQQMMMRVLRQKSVQHCRAHEQEFFRGVLKN